MVIRNFRFEQCRWNGDPAASMVGLHPKCYYCGEEISEHLIHWHGYGEEFVNLHPRCAMTFAAHLLADAFRAETGFRVPVNGDDRMLLHAMAENCFKLLDQPEKAGTALVSKNIP